MSRFIIEKVRIPHVPGFSFKEDERLTGIEIFETKLFGLKVYQKIQGMFVSEVRLFGLPIKRNSLQGWALNLSPKK